MRDAESIAYFRANPAEIPQFRANVRRLREISQRPNVRRDPKLAAECASQLTWAEDVLAALDRPARSRAPLSAGERKLMATLDATERRLAALKADVASAALLQQLQKVGRALEDARPPLPVYSERH